MTNKQKILNLLYKSEWVCTTDMYALYIADPRTILSAMKKKNEVVNRWCQNPAHKHNGQMKEWALVRIESAIVKEFRDEYNQRTKERAERDNSRDITPQGQMLFKMR